MLFSVVDFSVVVLLAESGVLPSVCVVVVVDSEDFSDVAVLGAAGSPSGPWAPGAPGAPGAPATGVSVVVSFTVSLHPTPTAPKVPIRNAMAA